MLPMKFSLLQEAHFFWRGFQAPTPNKGDQAPAMGGQLPAVERSTVRFPLGVPYPISGEKVPRTGLQTSVSELLNDPPPARLRRRRVIQSRPRRGKGGVVHRPGFKTPENDHFSLRQNPVKKKGQNAHHTRLPQFLDSVPCPCRVRWSTLPLGPLSILLFPAAATAALVDFALYNLLPSPSSVFFSHLPWGP